MMFYRLKKLTYIFGLCLGICQGASAVPNKARVIQLRAQENVVTCLLVDEKNGFAYAATAEHNFRYTLDISSAHVIRIRLSDFTRQDHVSLQAGENPLKIGFVDPVGQFAYFGIYGDPNKNIPAKVVKIGLLGLKRLNVVSLGRNEFGVSSSILDPIKNIGYFGTLYGSVSSINLEDMTLQGTLELQRENNAFQCAIIDRNHRFAYFGTSSGNIMKIQLSDFNPQGSLTVLRGEKGFSCAVLHPDQDYAYFGTQGSPAKIVNLSLSDFKASGVIRLEPGEGNLVAAFSDPAKGLGYFVSGENPAHLIRIRLTDFHRVDSILLPLEANPVQSAAFDLKHQALYVGTSGNPAKILKLPLPE